MYRHSFPFTMFLAWGGFGLMVFLAACGHAPAEIPPEETAGVTWEEALEVDSGGGHRGPWRMNESEFHFVDDPTVAINDEGEVGVAWADHVAQEILFQRFGPDGEPRFEEPVNVSSNPGVFSWLPRVVLTSGEEPSVYILWQEIVFSGGSHGGEIFFAHSTDGGETFSSYINLSETEAGAGKGRWTADRWHNGSLDIAVGLEGTIHTAWTEYEGRLWYRRSTDGGEQFSEAVLLAGEEGEDPARGPSLAVDGETVYLAWTVGEDEAADIRMATSGDDGESFDEPVIVHENDGHADGPALAVDHNGTLHLIYGESPTGPLERSEILYARSDGDGFEEPAAIAASHTEAPAGANFPALDVDADGNVYAVWEFFPHPRQRSRGLGFTRSTDGGDSFAEAGIIPGSVDPDGGFNGSQQGLLMRKLAVNADGDIVVVNSSFNPGASSHVWLIRGRGESPS